MNEKPPTGRQAAKAAAPVPSPYTAVMKAYETRQQEEAAGQKGWKRWLNYQSIVKQIPFFLFLAVLAVLYIYNGHQADKTIRSINRTEKEVKELRYEYTAVKGELISRSKQSELVKVVDERLGLKELTASPVVLTDSSLAR